MPTYCNTLTKSIPYKNNYKNNNLYKQTVIILENLSTKLVHIKDQIEVIKSKYKYIGPSYKHMWPNYKQTRSRSNAMRSYKRYKAIKLSYKVMRFELHM